MRTNAMSAAFVGAILFCCAAVTDSQGAETVLGDGAPHGCYEAAQFNGSPRDGIAACSAAIDSNALTLADRAATFVNRGILKIRIADFSGALEDYDAGLILNPDLAEAYVDRGAALIMIKRYGDAIADLSKGISLGTQDMHVAYYDRGIVRERKGDLVGACADYRQALALKPDFALASVQLDICPRPPDTKPG